MPRRGAAANGCHVLKPLRYIFGGSWLITLNSKFEFLSCLRCECLQGPPLSAYSCGYLDAAKKVLRQSSAAALLAVLFITSRLLYIICYLADWAALRSLAWAIGMGIIAALFIVSA